MAVELVANGVAPFSLPFECLTYRPGPDTLIRPFKNKDSERCIHGHVALLPEEEELLAKFDKYCESRNIEFSPMMSSKCTRYISRARGKIPLAVTRMQTTEKWRKTTFERPLRDDHPELRADLQSGAIYFGGRDKFLRPLVVMVLKRFPTEWFKKGGQDRLLRVVIFMMEYLQRYMFFPGNVENLSVLIDMEGTTLLQTPASVLKHMIGVLSNHYMGRVYKIFILHCPAMITMTYNLLKGWITDRQQQKMDFLRAGDNSHLTELFHPLQLEKTYGGERENLVAPFYPFQFLPGPFDTDAKASTASTIPDAHIIMSEEMVCGGLLWRSHKTSCPERKLLRDTARQREILELANLLPEERPRGQSSDALMAAREPSSVANGGDRKTEERHSHASSSKAAESFFAQIALEGASTIPEVGSIASDRSLGVAYGSQMDGSVYEFGNANESTTLGSERNNELAALTSIGDTMSNGSPHDGGASEHSRRPLPSTSRVAAHIAADGNHAMALVPKLCNVTESAGDAEVQPATDSPIVDLSASPRLSLPAPQRKFWLCSC